MQSLVQLQSVLARSRRVPALAIGAGLLVLALTIALTTRQVRSSIREQIVRRDGTVLHAVALTQLEESVSEAGSEPPDLLAVVLTTSRLKGVLAARLMDGEGRFVEGFPVAVREESLTSEDVAVLRARQPVCRLRTGVDPRTVFYPDPATGARGELPLVLLEVNVPLHAGTSGVLLGIGQFLIEGHSVKAEFRELDWHLAYQALGAFGVAGAILAGAMGWGFRRLRQVNRQLEARTADLLRANQELALGARTSAIGAVTTHLIHGLKSPLAGLRQFVAGGGRGAGESGAEGLDWEQASASAERMEALIHDVVNVLREEESGAHYELSLDELAGLVTGRVRELAESRSVSVGSKLDGSAVLDNRTANLLAFILTNLLENAIEVSRAGQSVTLEVQADRAKTVFRVRDQGPGFPQSFRADPFTARRSTKEGGSGIGLAISRQLAKHLGASLELRESTSTGTVMELTVVLAAPGPQA